MVNINFFGYNSEASNLMRIKDNKIANEMIEVLYTDKVSAFEIPFFVLKG